MTYAQFSYIIPQRSRLSQGNGPFGDTDVAFDLYRNNKCEYETRNSE